MEISKQTIDRSGMFDLIKSYLVHYAFVETLQALEEEDNDKKENLSNIEEKKFEEDDLISNN